MTFRTAASRSSGASIKTLEVLVFGSTQSAHIRRDLNHSGSIGSLIRIKSGRARRIFGETRGAVGTMEPLSDARVRRSKNSTTNIRAGPPAGNIARLPGLSRLYAPPLEEPPPSLSPAARSYVAVSVARIVRRHGVVIVVAAEWVSVAIIPVG